MKMTLFTSFSGQKKKIDGKVVGNLNSLMHGKKNMGVGENGNGFMEPRSGIDWGREKLWGLNPPLLLLLCYGI